MPLRARIPIFLGLFLFLWLTVTASALAGTLTASLLSHASSGPPVQRYRACLFLGETVLNDTSLNALRARIPHEPSLANRVCLRYVLAKRSQESKANRAFVMTYPADSNIRLLWKRQEQAGYPLGIAPPPERYLAQRAYTSSKALRKLVAGLEYADGAHRESLIELISRIYLQHPGRVVDAARAARIPIAAIKQHAGAMKCHE